MIVHRQRRERCKAAEREKHTAKGSNGLGEG